MSIFRRRPRDEEQADTAPAGSEPEENSAGKTPRPNGPYDSTEVDLERARADRVDLGGLLVPRVEGMKLQLQVEEKSGRPASVMAVLDDGAVQMIPVAAPRSSGLWDQTRLQIAADAQRRGGTVEEAAGPFGTEIRIVIPVTTPDGKKAVQPSRTVGVDGPRWMLRATFLGGATSNADTFGRLVQVVRDTIVVRGDHPLAPGDLIALRPPQQPDQQP
ncbi:MAG TPA: DUF3710 domain-containing protein [Jiangellales bacterium]|nr:DUF3710 domain-containing protein [Jiangellales bacterium]